MRNRPVWFYRCGAHALPFTLVVLTPILCFGQESSPTPSSGEAEVEQVVVSATRFDIPLDQSPASVSVISAEDLEQKQIERVSDALREVPGLSVVQTGTAGQLTSVLPADYAASIPKSCSMEFRSIKVYKGHSISPT